MSLYVVVKAPVRVRACVCAGVPELSLHAPSFAKRGCPFRQRSFACSQWRLQEGELRPQLLDRFGLSVQVATLMDKDQRVQMVLDRMAYEADPDKLCEEARPEQVRVHVGLAKSTA